MRSNCKWLYEALNVPGHESADLLLVLQVNRIEDYKSGNPTVIRRHYKDAKGAIEAQYAAEASGMTVEELANAAKADKAVAAQRESEMIAEMIAGLATRISSGNSPNTLAKEVKDIMTSAFKNAKRSEIVEVLHEAFAGEDYNDSDEC